MSVKLRTYCVLIAPDMISLVVVALVLRCIVCSQRFQSSGKFGMAVAHGPALAATTKHFRLFGPRVRESFYW